MALANTVSIAGTDTTATAIRTTMLYIITNARVFNTLRAEIASLGPAPPDSIISDDKARTMLYLQAVIKEGLRIHPPAAGLMAKVVPAGGDTFNGVRLPEGTRVGYCGWGVMRRHDVWGIDSTEFRPERWLEASPEKVREMESTLELVFGYGRWQCLGRNVALMELNKVFVEVSVLLAVLFEIHADILILSISYSDITTLLLLIPRSLGSLSTLVSLSNTSSGLERTSRSSRRGVLSLSFCQTKKRTFPLLWCLSCIINATTGYLTRFLSSLCDGTHCAKDKNVSIESSAQLNKHILSKNIIAVSEEPRHFSCKSMYWRRQIRYTARRTRTRSYWKWYQDTKLVFASTNTMYPLFYYNLSSNSEIRCSRL